MKKLKNSKGITLVALIITIVVLLILAVVTINTVQDGGIISYAKNAQQEYKNATQNENDVLAYYKTYLETNGTIGTWTDIYEKKNKGTSNEIQIIKSLNKDGSVDEIEIGSIVNYNPKIDKNGNKLNLSYTSYSNNNASSDKNSGRTSGYSSNQIYTLNEENGYSGKWQVMGTENGQILLISSGTIGEYHLYGRLGWQYGVSELNAISSIYGNGKGAESARSLKSEDINKLSGYNTIHTIPGNRFEYGEKITCTLKKGKIIYKSNNKEFESNATNFWYFNGNNWQKLMDGESTILEESIYRYKITTLTDYEDDDVIGIPIESKIYNMLVNGSSFYLANNWTSCSDGDYNTTYGIKLMSKSNGHLALCLSDGSENEKNKSIRAVVKLSKNVKLTKTVDGSYDITIDNK